MADSSSLRTAIIYSRSPSWFVGFVDAQRFFPSGGGGGWGGMLGGAGGEASWLQRKTTELILVLFLPSGASALLGLKD